MRKGYIEISNRNMHFVGINFLLKKFHSNSTQLKSGGHWGDNGTKGDYIRIPPSSIGLPLTNGCPTQHSSPAVNLVSVVVVLVIFVVVILVVFVIVLVVEPPPSLP